MQAGSSLRTRGLLKSMGIAIFIRAFPLNGNYLQWNIMSSEEKRLFEKNYREIEPVVQRISSFLLFGKKIDVMGREHFIIRGPSIIVGNHIGSYKDVATIYKIVPRPVVWTANRQLFNKREFKYLVRKHLKRHMKDFGMIANLILKPISLPLINYITKNISRIGTIPVDLSKRKTHAIYSCQENIKRGRTVVLLQGRGRVMKKDPHPYIHPFRRGAAIISYNIFQETKEAIPVTPVAMFGTHLAGIVPNRIKVNVGRPMYINDYQADGFTDTIERFRAALEKRTQRLFFEIVKS